MSRTSKTRGSALLFPGAKDPRPLDYLEKRWRQRGYRCLAGLDEAGRGPLAGPVVAAAVILPEKILPSSRLWKVRDSKTLRPKDREELLVVIQAEAVCVAVAEGSVEEVERLNILQASLLAMSRAAAALSPRPDLCLVDGAQVFIGGPLALAIPQGDRRSLSIAAASIVAKVTRDRLMLEFDAQYPGYGFCRHKGYGTAEHLAALARHGPCPIHRKSFRGVKELIKRF